MHLQFSSYFLTESAISQQHTIKRAVRVYENISRKKSRNSASCIINSIITFLAVTHRCEFEQLLHYEYYHHVLTQQVCKFQLRFARQPETTFTHVSSWVMAQVVKWKPANFTVNPIYLLHVQCSRRNKFSRKNQSNNCLSSMAQYSIR